MIILISVMRVIFGGTGIDDHAADRILDQCFAIGIVGGSGLGHLKSFSVAIHIPYGGMYSRSFKESILP